MANIIKSPENIAINIIRENDLQIGFTVIDVETQEPINLSNWRGLNWNFIFKSGSINKTSENTSEIRILSTQFGEGVLYLLSQDTQNIGQNQKFAFSIYSGQINYTFICGRFILICQ